MRIEIDVSLLSEIDCALRNSGRHVLADALVRERLAAERAESLRLGFVGHPPVRDGYYRCKWPGREEVCGTD